MDKVVKNMLMFHKFFSQRKYEFCATWITHKVCIWFFTWIQSFIYWIIVYWHIVIFFLLCC